MQKLTKKQELFCCEYLKDVTDPIRAYRVAYNVNSNKAASNSASRLLKNPKIKEYLKKMTEDIRDSLDDPDDIASTSEVLKYLTAVMRGSTESAVVVIEGTGEGMSKARLLYKPPDEKDRLKAGEALARSYGMFKDKVSAEIVVPRFEGEDDIED